MSYLLWVIHYNRQIWYRFLLLSLFRFSCYEILFSVASNFVRHECLRLKMSVLRACLELIFIYLFILENFRQRRLATSENERNNQLVSSVKKYSIISFSGRQNLSQRVHGLETCGLSIRNVLTVTVGKSVWIRLHPQTKEFPLFPSSVKTWGLNRFLSFECHLSCLLWAIRCPGI